MSRQRTVVVVIGLMLSLFLASMESTVISTAMPTIAGELGGLEAYSWVFTAFMLASTVTVPIFGKLSDIYGRRPLFLAAVSLFLLGSLLCGLAQSMEQLIAFRALQGLGAGGLLPLVFTMTGDMFTLQQRARVQGLFSGVWGVSSVAGPLLGGFIVDYLTWPWVFYINLVPGILASALVLGAWTDRPRVAKATRPAIDVAGVIVLTVAVVLLLLALMDLARPLNQAMLALALALGMLLFQIERRAADPIVPLRLFSDRMFAVACAQGFLAGCALFGSSSFVPLFAQTVLGTNATGAGALLMPMLLGWVFASILGGQIMVRVGFRFLAISGMTLLVIGSVLMAQASGTESWMLTLVSLALMGVGMGLSIPAFLIAVQTSVARSDMGAATSTVQFSRSIGGAIGVSVIGVVLSTQLAASLRAAGLDPAQVDVNQFMGEGAGSSLVGMNEAIRTGLAHGVQGVFVVALIAAILAFASTLFTPHDRKAITPSADAPVRASE